MEGERQEFHVGNGDGGGDCDGKREGCGGMSWESEFMP